MSPRGADLDDLKESSKCLGEAAVDPTMRPQVMKQMAAAADATRDVLLQSDIRTPDVPCAESLKELVRRYFLDGWPARDLRGNKGAPLLARGATVILSWPAL
jgi:hypothetical protein